MTSIDRLTRLTRAAAMLLVAALIALAAAGCGGGGGGDGGSVAKPQFAPEPGTYNQQMLIAAFSSTSGSTVRYTTDGSTPTATHGEIAFNGVIEVNESVTIRAVAVSSGGSVSAVATAVYAITPQAAQPVFTPSGGTYTTAQTVAIASTAGATIRYTTDGSAPSPTNGTVYAGPVSISASTTLSAIAYGDAFRNSDMRVATYTITGQVATPEFFPPAGTYSETQAVSISTATPGASIRYTTDGTAPTKTTGNIYAGAFQVSSSKTVRAIAYRTGWDDSEVAAADYVVMRKVSTPQISPASGTYGINQTVTMLTATSGAEIRYTVDGSTPTASSTLYAGAFPIGASGVTIKAIAIKNGWQDSDVATETYTLVNQAAEPVISPVAGDYINPVDVSIACSQADSTIRYTLTGVNPSTSVGTVYTAPFQLSQTTTVKAICYTEDLAPSGVVSARFAFPDPNATKVATPTISPATGSYRGFVDVTITTSTAGASLRYSTDGSLPTETTGIPYTGTFTLVSQVPVTVTAVGFKTGIEPSTAATATYTINPVVSAPVLTPAPGRYDAAQNITLSSATPGARIYFTTDGTTPTETPALLYSGSLNLASSKVVKAFAVKTGLLDSNVTVGMYTIGTAQSATFADLNLSLCVREALGIGINDPMTMQMLENALFTELDCSGRGIVSINGIQNLVNLEGLNLSHNAIRDATLLSGMDKLKKLDLSFNQLSTAEPLRGLVAMEQLNLSVNEIDDIDPLTGMENLSRLGLNHNAVADISPLAGMVLMTELDLGDNVTLFNIAPIAGMVGLTHLDLRGNSVANLAPLGGLTELKYLNLGSNRVTDLTALAGLTKLTDLFLNANLLSEGDEENPLPGGADSHALTPLTALHSLLALSVADNQVQDLYPIAGLTELRDLDISNNLVDDVRALSGLMKLETLSMDHNDITDVAPLMYLVNLKVLLAQENCVANFSPLSSTFPSLIIVSDPQSAGCSEIPRVAENPIFTPATGNYIGHVDVAIWSPTSGATILYTTDGTEPTVGATPAENIGTVYTGAFRLTETGTVKAIAYRPDWANSQSAVVAETYTVTPLVDTPAMDPVSGTFNGSVSVTMATTTPLATIRYTTDGSVPTEVNGTDYSTPIVISATTTLQAVAFRAGYSPSPVATEIYTIIPVAGAPQFTPGAGIYDGAVTVAITSGTQDAHIRYYIDYSTDTKLDTEVPTETVGTLYEGPITISGSTAILRAVAYKDGFVTSPVTEVTYRITPITATPSIQPNGGNFDGQVLVSILDATPSAVIFYTTDGSTPSSATGILYSSPFTLSATTTLKTIAYSPGLPPSAIASADFVVSPIMSDPVISPTSGIYPGKVDVVITCDSVAAIIRYTTDGSTPSSSNGTIYTGSFQLTATSVVKAIAYSPGSVDSGVVTANYTIEPVAAAPYFVPGPGTYQGSVDVVIRSNTLNALIRYTTDGTEPTSSHGALYAGRFTLTQSATIKAVAYKAGWATSPVSSSTYTVIPYAAQPYFLPGAGSFDLSVDVAIIGPTDGSTVRYTLDGTIPTEATGTLFAAPIHLTESKTITAVAFKAGMAASRPATGAFIINTDPITVFPDPNLDACVRTALGAAPDETLTVTGLASLQVLDCSSRAIESINGIQNLRALTDLNLSDNLITDGSLVQGITTLLHLDMSNNRLTTMAPEGYLLGLLSLKMSDNLISDMTPVAKLEFLSQLHLAGNMIQDLAPLNSQVLITDLDLSGNILIDDITPIATLEEIQRIGLSYNRITDLTPLQNLEFVEYLDLGWNELTDVSPISGLTTMLDLKLNNNHLTSLGAVGQLVHTQTLNLRGNLLIDISPLAGLGEIIAIELDDNQIVDVSPLAAMQNARTMSLTNNNISSVAPLSALLNLDTLNLSGNCISDLTPVAFVPTVNATPMRASCE